MVLNDKILMKSTFELRYVLFVTRMVLFILLRMWCFLRLISTKTLASQFQKISPQHYENRKCIEMPT